MPRLILSRHGRPREEDFLIRLEINGNYMQTKDILLPVWRPTRTQTVGCSASTSQCAPVRAVREHQPPKRATIITFLGIMELHKMTVSNCPTFRIAGPTRASISHLIHHGRYAKLASDQRITNIKGHGEISFACELNLTYTEMRSINRYNMAAYHNDCVYIGY